MSERILVVGAVLVDLIGTYSEDALDIQNHAGSVKMTVGGAGFNISSNIAIWKEAKCIFYSYCPHKSLSYSIVKRTCESISLSTRWISDTADSLYEPAYIALMKGKSLDRGVTSAPIERARLIVDRELEECVKASALIAVETNLRSDQIGTINRLAQKYRKPICCMIVSDAKASRITGTGFEQPFELVSLNSKEARHLGFEIDQIKSQPGVGAQLCQRLNAKKVIVTNGDSGFVIVTASDHKQIVAVDPVNKTNDLGAGDALFAACCVSLVKGEVIGSNECNSRIASWTAKVLEVETANLVPYNTNNLRKTDGWMGTAIASFVASMAILLGAMAFGTSNAKIFWTMYFASCAAGGLTGSLIKSVLSSKKDRAQIDWRLVVVGCIVGTISGVVNAMLNLNSGLPVATPGHPEQINFVTVGAFLSSFMSSLAFEAILGQFGFTKGDNE